MLKIDEMPPAQVQIFLHTPESEVVDALTASPHEHVSAATILDFRLRVMDSQLTALRIAHEAHIDTDSSGSEEEVPRGDRRVPGRRRITKLASSDEEDDAPDEQHEETEQE